jgi:hypothetical protein
MKRAIAGDGRLPEPEMTPETMAAYLLGPEGTIEDFYSDSARRCGRFILTCVRAHPELQDAPTETVYDWATWRESGGPNRNEMPPVLQRGWSDLLKEIDPEGYRAAVAEITGFQWGWAANAARFALNLPPVANPAIVEIEVGD